MTDKKVPLRMCIACRESKTKENLLRIVKVNDEYVINNSNKVCGRSSYVCKNSACVEKVIKNKLLHKTFKQNIDNSLYDALRESLND